MHARKLILTALLAGPLLGALSAVNPVLKPAPEPSWRKMRPDVIFTNSGYQFGMADPEDLSPLRPTPDYARRHPMGPLPPDPEIELPSYRSTLPDLADYPQPEPETVAAPPAQAAQTSAMAPAPNMADQQTAATAPVESKEDALPAAADAAAQVL